MFFHIVLYQPEIPPNTGNIMRLCANTGSHLHLIHPLGFCVDDKHCRRAGLDYLDDVLVTQHLDYPSFLATQKPQRLFACSTKGRLNYASLTYQAGDAFLFGPETRGLPETILQAEEVSEVIRIPMTANSRSLNLSNAAAVVLYEAWRQCGFLS